MSFTYTKHQSFNDLKGSSTERLVEVTERIKTLEPTLIKEDPTRDEIVAKAITALLSEEIGQKFKLHANTVEEISRLADNQISRYLYYRYRYETFPDAHKLDDYPPCLQIEPTSICNYRCVFCYQTESSFNDPKHGHMGKMPIELFKKIIDEVEGKIEAITLASRGEPLIHREFPEMLSYMNGKFLASKINTNASLLTEKLCHAILSSDLQTLVFSADAASEPLYSQLRVKGSLEKVQTNVKLFSDIRTKHYSNSKLITRVSGVKVQQEQRIEDMMTFWGDHVDQVAFVNYNPWEDSYTAPINDVTSPCSDLWRRMFIWWDGIANPCDVDFKSHLAVGNANEKTVKELWASEGYSNLREQHLDMKRCNASPCQRCVFT